MKALHRHRRVLEDLAGAVYESLPGPVVDGAGRLHPLLAMLAGHHCGVSEIFGRTRIGGLQARILAAGSGPGIEYLLRRFFGTVTRRRPIARVPLPRLARFLERRRGDYDLALARVDRLSGRLLLGRDYLALPEWVGTRLPVPADPERHARGSKSLRNDMRKAARNGLTCRISRDESAFDAFYHGMYVPYARARFGAESVVSGIHRLRRVFRAGGLVLVEREATPLAAAHPGVEPWDGVFHRLQRLRRGQTQGVSGDLCGGQETHRRRAGGQDLGSGQIGGGEAGRRVRHPDRLRQPR